MGLTLREKERYYRDEDKAQKIKRVILNNARNKGHIVHGAKALNKQLPSYLDKPTEDYDVFSSTPKQTANKIEKKLDRKFGGDFFRTEPAQHQGTTKVISNVTERTTADYTKTPSDVMTVRRDGINYANLGFLRGRAVKAARDPTQSFRKDKDEEAIQRIDLSTRIRRREKRKLSPSSFLNELFPPVKFKGRRF